MILHKIKLLYTKLTTKLSDGSMDSHHYQKIFYCLSPVFLLLLFGILELSIIKLILSFVTSSLSVILELFFSSIFLLLNIFLFVVYIKNMCSAFKRRYLLLAFLIFPTVILLFLTTLFWLNAIIADIHNLLVYTFNLNLPGIFPYEAVAPVTNSLAVIVSLMMIFLLPIATSLLLNSFLPESLQKKDVSVKEKLMRLLRKLFVLSLIFFFSYVFSIIDKNNFGSISILTTLLSFLLTPKTILRLFSSVKDIESKQISEDILIKFDRIKFIYYEFIFSWSISIYIIEPKKTEDRILASAIIFFILLFTTTVIQEFLKRKKKNSFSGWVVDNENGLEEPTQNILFEKKFYLK